MTRRALFVVSVAVATTAAGLARADGGLDGQRFAPAVGAAGGFVVERPIVPRQWGWGLGAFVSYGYRPVVIRDRTSDSIVASPLRDAMSADIVGSIGLFNFFELGVHVPIRPVWKGDAVVAGGRALNAKAGLGDIRVVPKFGIVDTGSESFHFSLGAMIPVSLPTGNDNDLRGSDATSLEPRLLLGIGGNKWDLIFSGGYLARIASNYTGLAGKDEITFGSAFTYNIAKPVDLQLEIFGAHLPDAKTAGSHTPLEGLVGAIIWPTDELSIYVGAGPGITAGLGSPDFRGAIGVRFGERVPGRNRFRDHDGDGVDDDKDKCPNEPEDKDGFQDEDGCPDPDNDNDGVLDADDECPETPEEVGGDGDGCPDKGRVIYEDGKIIVVGKVQFASGSAVILKKSEPLVDDVATLLKEHPELKHVRIEGHTDSTGPAAFNDKLSQDRADAVKAALVARGISADRLETKGYGSSKPMSSNDYPVGRARNRRVEFTIHE